MSKLKLEISMSVDGYIAGPNATREEPLGVGGENLHEWVVRLASWKKEHGHDSSEGDTGTDDDVLAEASASHGAVIMGKRMFCGEDGPWGDDPFQGWWGDDPPFKKPVFVLTHHEREPLELGETRFEFITDGIESALEQARDAAGDEDIQISGGANVAQQYLAAGLLDEMQIHIAPVLLGGGVRLFDGELEGPRDLRITRTIESPGVTHVRYEAAYSVGSPMVEGVDFVFLWTQDFERAERFYVDLLGLEKGPAYADHGGEFEAPGFTISMLQADRVGMEFEAGTSAIAFRVDDVAKRRAELEAEGVEFSGEIVDSGVCHQSYFTDPDGNRLILHHRYAP